MPSPLRLTPLLEKILLEAGKGGLDIAGPALVDGAWPILKGALKPVLDRLDKQLGGDVTRSPDIARQAIEAFDRDPNLQARLRQGLLDALDPVIRSGQAMSDDVQRLVLIAEGNQRALDQVVSEMHDVARAVKALQQNVQAGMDLNPQALQAIATILQQQITNAIGARQLGQTAAATEAEPRRAPATEAFVDEEFTQLNERALHFLREGDPRRALSELRRGLAQVGALLAETPTDTRLTLHMGYLYKTTAQAGFQLGDDAAANLDLEKAERAFMLAKDDVPPDRQTLAEMAGAINGLGDVFYERGEVRRAIEQFKVATTLLPTYAYAWHDLFVAYLRLAQAGEPVDRADMRHALAQVKRHRSGYADLDDDYLFQLGAQLKDLPIQPRRGRTSGDRG